MKQILIFLFLVVLLTAKRAHKTQLGPEDDPLGTLPTGLLNENGALDDPLFTDS